MKNSIRQELLRLTREVGSSGRARELGELGLEERDDGGVLVVQGEVKGSESLGC